MLNTISTQSTAEPAPPPRRINSLQPIHLRANWKQDRVQLPHYLIRGMGGCVDDVAENLVVAIRNRRTPNVGVGWVGGSENKPGRTRPLRITNTPKPGHVAGVDVNLHSQGGDLYVRFDSVPRTRITLLRRALYVGAFLIVFTLGFGLLFNATNAHRALVQDYATKYSNGPAARSIKVHEILTGRYQYGRPWGYVKFFDEDPLLFLTTMGKVPALLGAAIGFLLFMIPKDVIRHPCRWLGWPTPDVFRNTVLAHQANVERAMSEMLATVYEVYEDQKIPVHRA